MPWHEVLATPPTPPVSNDTGEKHEYSSTQFTLPPEHEVTKNLQSLAASIPPAQLAEKGIEPESHITLKYGNPGTDTAPIAAALKGKGPVTVTLGTLHVFPGKDGDPDALVADIVESPKLHAMNKAVGEAVEHTGSTFPTYHPHVTIAYLKPGEGAQYEGLKVPGITGEQITLGNVTFSGKNGQQTDIPLTGGQPANQPTKSHENEGVPGQTATPVVVPSAESVAEKPQAASNNVPDKTQEPWQLTRAEVECRSGLRQAPASAAESSACGA